MILVIIIEFSDLGYLTIICSCSTPAKTHAIHRNDIRDLHTSTINKQFFIFSQPYFLVTILTLSCHAASACNISSISDHPRRSYDVLSIIKMATAAVQSYVWFRIGWRHCHQEAEIYYLQTKFVDGYQSRFKYNYFRFRKTNFCHIGIPLMYPIPTPLPLSAFRDAFNNKKIIQIGPLSAELSCHIDF